ncbi:MAG: class B sortase [Clostridia bacterium]|nr:class B sortase [Clostridia bacterium]
MKRCLACYKKCEDSVTSCPHCGYGSENFTHNPSALPIGTVIGERFVTGKSVETDNCGIVYIALDKNSKKICRLTEYFPKNNVVSRKGNTVVFSDIPTADARIDEICKSNPDSVRENGTCYYLPAVNTVVIPEEKKQNKKSLRNVFRAVSYTASIICLILSVGYLLNYYVIEPWRHNKQTQNLSDMLETTAISNTDIDPLEQVRKDYPGVDFPDGMNLAFALLYSQNPEIAGWVRINGTDIDFAVMQSEDNNKYLKTDFFGKSTNYGQPYFDYRNALRTLDRNTIIHGHNMRHDDKIFGTLEKYRNPQAFIDAPIIEMKTLYGNYTFKIYAVFIVNSSLEQDNGKRFYYNFTQAADDDFQKYLTELDKRKLYTTGVDITKYDKIITLSTCCYDFYDARLAVVGRLIREGESTEIDPSLVTVNENPKFPQAYYDATKTVNPYKNDEHVFMVP